MISTSYAVGQIVKQAEILLAAMTDGQRIGFYRILAARFASEADALTEDLSDDDDNEPEKS